MVWIIGLIGVCLMLLAAVPSGADMARRDHDNWRRGTYEPTHRKVSLESFAASHAMCARV